jgi:RNA polymerase sigma factor (sigma-70 family)
MGGKTRDNFKCLPIHIKKKEIPLAVFDDGTDFLNELFSNPILNFFEDFSTPETEYLKSLFWERFEDALDKLPQNQRDVFELTEFEGVSFKELAERTGLPLNTLLSRKRYAVLSLRKSLSDIYGDIFPGGKT